MMNGYNSERLSQEGECYQDGEGGILERASTFARRVLEEIEALTGTTSCKSINKIASRSLGRPPSHATRQQALRQVAMLKAAKDSMKY